MKKESGNNLFSCWLIWPLTFEPLLRKKQTKGKWHQIADTFEMKWRIPKCHPVAYESPETPHQSVSQSGRFRIYSPQSDVYSPLPFLNERLAITPSLAAENYCLLNEELTFHLKLALPPFKLGTCMWFNLPHGLTPNVHFLPSFHCSPGKSAVEVEDSRKWEGRGWMRRWGGRREIKGRQVEKWKEKDLENRACFLQVNVGLTQDFSGFQFKIKPPRKLLYCS